MKRSRPKVRERIVLQADSEADPHLNVIKLLGSGQLEEEAD